MRITRRFTRFEGRQFALHEVLGHGLQNASYAARCARETVPWVRMESIHALHQVLLEGLAEAMPLFITPNDEMYMFGQPVGSADVRRGQVRCSGHDPTGSPNTYDEILVARVRLANYTQLVKSELHLSVNSGVSIEKCAEHAKVRVPWWKDAYIGDFLADRRANPRLRTYLWAYPAGLDWFATLSEADTGVIERVLHAAYRDPLSPRDLAALWPGGPPIGGPGADGDG
jgi:hypothetical protein